MIIPNRFGLFRQLNRTLYGLDFLTKMNIEDYNFSFLTPTYHNGGYYTSNGSITTNAAFSYSDPMDLTGYDYVLFPCASTTGSATSGLRDNLSSGTLAPRTLSGSPTGFNDFATAWMLAPVDTNVYLYISSVVDSPFPVIAFKKNS